MIRSPDTGFWQTGHPYRTLRLKFVSIFRERIVAGGFIDARRLDGLIAEADPWWRPADTDQRTVQAAKRSFPAATS